MKSCLVVFLLLCLPAPGRAGTVKTSDGAMHTSVVEEPPPPPVVTAGWGTMEILVKSSRKGTGWTISAPPALLAGLARVTRQYSGADLAGALPEVKRKVCAYRFNLDTFEKPPSRREGEPIDAFVSWYANEVKDGWGDQRSLNAFMAESGPPPAPKGRVLEVKPESRGSLPARRMMRLFGSEFGGNLVHDYVLDTGRFFLMVQYASNNGRGGSDLPADCQKVYAAHVEAMIKSLAPKQGGEKAPLTSPR